MRQVPPKTVSSAGCRTLLNDSLCASGMCRMICVIAVAKSIAPKPAQMTLRVRAKP